MLVDFTSLLPPSSFLMMQQYTVDDDVYAGKSAESRHLKPGELSTGTTIMAVQFDGGVVLCAGESVLYRLMLFYSSILPQLMTLILLYPYSSLSSQTHGSPLGPTSRIVHPTRSHNFTIISGVVGLVQPLIHRH